MKKKLMPPTHRLIQRRDAWMKKLGELGPMTRGSLVTARRGGHLAHQLTVSVKGKTHTVYVPKEMIPEVKTWIRNHRQMQRILKEVSKLNMAIIHRHVPESRGGGKASSSRRPTL